MTPCGPGAPLDDREEGHKTEGVVRSIVVIYDAGSKLDLSVPGGGDNRNPEARLTCRHERRHSLCWCGHGLRAWLGQPPAPKSDGPRARNVEGWDRCPAFPGVCGFEAGNGTQTRDNLL